MMETVIPRDSTKNGNLSGKGEPAMMATVNPRTRSGKLADVVFWERATGHDGDGDPSTFSSSTSKGQPAMMATVIPRDSTKNRNLSGKGEPAMMATVNPRTRSGKQTKGNRP